MTDYKKMIAEHSCKPNQGCGVMTICMCGVAEDMADEIERLREALRQCYVLFNDARNGPPNLFKICCEGMRVVRAENVLGRGNG